MHVKQNRGNSIVRRSTHYAFLHFSTVYNKHNRPESVIKSINIKIKMKNVSYHYGIKYDIVIKLTLDRQL
jgi:hypothetical protein